MKSAFSITVALFGLRSHCRTLDDVAVPSITPVPRFDVRQLERSPAATAADPVSLAEVLLTAVPESLRQIAATDIPAASKILWLQFLDGKHPSWFTALPTDIQSYLSSQFGPSTTATAEASTTYASSDISATSQASSTTGESQENSSSSQNSQDSQKSSSDAVVATSYITVTVGLEPTAQAVSHSGLTTADKVNIGLGVPLAILAIAAVVLGICLVRRRRRRSRHSIESRPPTPAFMGSTMAPQPTTGTRGGEAPVPQWSDNESYGNLGISPMRQKMDSHGSFRSLNAVPEEDDFGVVSTHGRSPRRSKGFGSASDWKLQSTVTATPVDHYSNDGPYPSLLSQDWQNQHPAYRNTPYTQNTVASSKIPRKPVRVSSNSNVFGGYAKNKPQKTYDVLPSQGRQSSPRRSESDWPLSNNTSGKCGSKFSNYWRVQVPTYERYEQLYDGK